MLHDRQDVLASLRLFPKNVTWKKAIMIKTKAVLSFSLPPFFFSHIVCRKPYEEKGKPFERPRNL